MAEPVKKETAQRVLSTPRRHLDERCFVPQPNHATNATNSIHNTPNACINSKPLPADRQDAGGALPGPHAGYDDIEAADNKAARELLKNLKDHPGRYPGGIVLWAEARSQREDDIAAATELLKDLEDHPGRYPLNVTTWAKDCLADIVGKNTAFAAAAEILKDRLRYPGGIVLWAEARLQPPQPLQQVQR